jgi:hypothetical protein
LPEGSIWLGPKVTYSWGKEAPSIFNLLVWHFCDHHLWAGREVYDKAPEKYSFWVPTGVRAHQLVSAEPLHLEPSILWPDCCGMHGFIRDGRWIDA